MPNESQRLCRKCRAYGTLKAALDEALRNLRDERSE